MLLVAKPIDDELERLNSVVIFGQSLQRHGRDGGALFVASWVFDLHGRILVRADDQLVFFKGAVLEAVGVGGVDVEAEGLPRLPV